ncbi:hypothetical protein EVAR_42022_1 [Eumeta japonica]|uniref:Transmembrane protein n=1 Tax=Eumeta variegata TaxID=151549 RepID=A0A4C1WP74_EUMVA|nr:hypothetical protein EVAR_42022_1 [Eumeta japonica]
MGARRDKTVFEIAAASPRSYRGCLTPASARAARHTATRRLVVAKLPPLSRRFRALNEKTENAYRIPFACVCLPFLSTTIVYFLRIHWEKKVDVWYKYTELRTYRK